MLAVEVHTIVTEWGTLRFRLTDFFQQRTVVGPHLSVKPRFDCTTISLLHKKFLLQKFLMTSLHVICGLAPPQSKILGTPIVPSFSDHMCIRFQVQSRIQKQTKMFRNLCRTCWKKYVNELEQKLNERILQPVPVPSSKEDIDVLANKVHSVITKSNEAACPMRKSLRKKDKIGGILS